MMVGLVAMREVVKVAMTVFDIIPQSTSSCLALCPFVDFVELVKVRWRDDGGYEGSGQGGIDRIWDFRSNQSFLASLVALFLLPSKLQG